MNIFFVQNGNYAEAYQRFQDGGPETYRDQRASVDVVAKLASQHAVTTLAICDEPHDIELAENLRSVGVPYQDLSSGSIAEMFDRFAPDRLICRTPHWKIIREARRRQVPTLPQFADIFTTSGPRSIYRNLRLRWFLRGSHIACVTNHSKNASVSMHKALLLPKSRIVPWDRRVVESNLEPKAGVSSKASLSIFYAGPLTVQKGIDDVLQALRLLTDRGVSARLSLASRDDPAPWQSRVADLRLSEHVLFAGLLPNDRIVPEMRSHDIVVVPTRHDYAEGLPNTLREALAARTPLVLSDHPAFTGRLSPDRDCVVFRAGDAESLAEAIMRLNESTDLYQRLSANAAGALEALPFGLYWDQLWNLFLKDPRPNADWVEQNSLKTLGLWDTIQMPMTTNVIYLV